MPSERATELAEQYDILVLADTLSHRALVALYLDLLSIGGTLQDEDIQEIINALRREACTEPMLGLGWLYFECGQKALRSLLEEEGEQDERDFKTLMVILAINAIAGFPENIEGQEDLFEKMHDSLKAGIEVAGPEIIETVLEDLQDILLESSRSELDSLCRDRGMSEEEITSALEKLQVAFESGHAYQQEHWDA